MVAEDMEMTPAINPTNTRCDRDPENSKCMCSMKIRPDTVDIEDTVNPKCGEQLKEMLRAYKRGRSTPKDTPKGTAPVRQPLATLRERDQWNA